MIELRCDNKMLGVLDGEVLEIRCKSAKCGHAGGQVVIHRFNVLTGHLLETRQYKDPGRDIQHDRTDG